MTVVGDIQNLGKQLNSIEQRLTGFRSGVDASKVDLPYLAGATYTNLEQWLDNTCSAMRISGGAVAASGANEIDVALGKGILKITDSEIGGNVQFDWAAETDIVVAADVTTWVGIEYNGGSPKVKTNTDLSNFNFNTDFILARVYNNGGVVCVLNAGSYYSNFQHRVCYRFFDTEAFVRAAGAVIADEGNLDFSITEGRFYCGTTSFVFSLWDCSGADTFTYWYRDGGVGWTQSAGEAAIDPDHYDDGDGVLGNLSANRYGVHWVYICHDDNVHVQFGQGDYKLNEAEAATVPTGPDFFIANAKLAGKIIVKVGAGVLTDVLSAFEEIFIGAAASIHNELGGLQGGQADQYYHLNATEHPYVSGVNAQSLLTIATPTFDDLTISTPVNIYALSHDAFADWDGDKHVAHSGVDVTAGTGLTGGGDISITRTIAVDVGIGLNKIPPITVADVGDDDYARFTATGLEGRHPTELLGDCSAQAGAAFDWNTQAIQNIGDIQAAGHVGLADGAVDPDIGINYDDLLTDTDNSPKIGISSYLQVAKTVAAMTSIGYGFLGSVTLDSTNTQNWTHALIGLRGLQCQLVIEASSAGTVTGATCLFTLAVIADAATVTNLYGIYIQTPIVGGAKVTNEYGIYVASQNTGATLNYAIYTNAGLVHFGGDVDAPNLSLGVGELTCGSINRGAGTLTLEIAGAIYAEIAASTIAFNAHHPTGGCRFGVEAEGTDQLAGIKLTARDSVPADKTWYIDNRGGADGVPDNSLKFYNPGGAFCVVFEDGAGANSLVVDSNSRVGIGTAAPNVALEVNGDMWIYYQAGSTNLWLKSGTTGGNALYRIKASDDDNNYYFGTLDDDGNFVFYSYGVPDTVYTIGYTSGNLYFYHLVGIGGAALVTCDLVLRGTNPALALKETTTPTQNLGYGKLYTKADNMLYFQSGDGVEHALAYAP